MPSVATSSPPSAQPPRTADSLRVVNWPLRDTPATALAALTLCGLVGWGAWQVADSAADASLAAVALFAATGRLWRRAEYELSAQGLTRRTAWRTVSVPWRSVSRVEVHARGVLLLIDAREPARLPLRSWYLAWGSQREAVLDQIESALLQQTLHPVTTQTFQAVR